MEGILGQESLAKLWVTQFAIMVLVESRHKECHLIVRDPKAQVFQAVDQVLDTRRASPWLIEYPEGINQIKVSLETQLDFDLFNGFL